MAVLLPKPQTRAGHIRRGISRYSNAFEVGVLGTNISDDYVYDLVAAAVEGNTESFITVTFQPSDNTIDFEVAAIDEDNMESNSDLHLPTQQSVKAYVDYYVGIMPTLFLYLNCSNDPLTGDLHTLNDILVSPGSSWVLDNCCYAFDSGGGSHDYIGDADGLGGVGALWYNEDTGSFEWIGVGDPTTLFSNLNGETDIDCTLWTLASTFYVTTFYHHGQLATIEALLDGFTGGDYSIDDTEESIFAASGGVYVYAGDPTGWSVVAGYEDPPEVSVVYDYLTKLRADGRGQIASDFLVRRDLDVTNSMYIYQGRLVIGMASQVTLSGGGRYTWTASGSGTNEWYLKIDGGNPYINSVTSLFIDDVEAIGGTVGSLANLEFAFDDNDTLGYDTIYIRLDAGSPESEATVKAAMDTQTFPGMTDNMIQAFKVVANPVGNAAAFILGFQDASTDAVVGQLWALNMGMSLYGDCNYSTNVYPFQGSVRLDNNGHTAVNIAMQSSRFTMTGGAHASSISNVGQLSFFEAITSREGGDALSTVTNLYLYKDSLTFEDVGGGSDFLVTNFYGIYIKDHSAKVSGVNWGIYNLSPTYLGQDVTLATKKITGVDEIQLVPKSSSSGAEGTIYYDAEDNAIYVGTE